MSDRPFPFIPKELLDALNKQFPERSAELKWTDREVWHKSGQCSVVRFLNEKFKEQNENILESTTNVFST